MHAHMHARMHACTPTSIHISYMLCVCVCVYVCGQVLGAILVGSAAAFAVVARRTLEDGVVGLSISYALQITGLLNMFIRLFTETENNFNSVERISHYVELQVPNRSLESSNVRWNVRSNVRMFDGMFARLVPPNVLWGQPEAPPVIEGSRPDDSWPDRGEITISDLVMRYRPDLPPVIDGLSVTLAPGEKVGVVGRTGAGKPLVFPLVRL